MEKKLLLTTLFVLIIPFGGKASVILTDISPRELYQQDKQKTQTLFSGDIRHGGFGALIYGITSVNGQPAYLRGTRGAWVVNFNGQHALHIGLAGYRTKTDVELTGWDPDDVNEPKLSTSYGGFEVEYTHRPYKIIHIGTQLLIGTGDVKYDNRDIDIDKTRDTYFALQPGAHIILNVTRWFRMSGGAYYRYINGARLEGTSDTDLSGLSAIVGLRFGKF